MLPWIQLILGAFACSTSAVLIKMTDLDPTFLAAARLLLAAAVLSPFWFQAKFLKTDTEDVEKPRKRAIALAALFLGLHFVSWNVGARMTLAAHATLIVNMVPVVMPIVLWLSHREAINRAEVIATFISLIGVGWLGVSDYHFSKAHLQGDLVCLLSMVFFACYLSIGRRNSKNVSILAYVTPVYFYAGLLCLGLAFIRGAIEIPSGREDWISVVGLAIIPTLMGHSLINMALRVIRGQIAAVVNLLQFITSGVLAFWLFNEVPKPVFYGVSLIVLVACVFAIYSHQNMDCESD